MSDTFLRETLAEIPVRGTFDTIVCGAGPAGVAAAIASARRGASTLLIEMQGCLGGVWTAGVLSWIIDGHHKGGFMQELLDLLDSEHLRTVNQETTYGHAFDPEMMKRLLERLCLQAGVRIRLHTMIAGAVRDANGRVTHLVTESKSGREAWGARVFIDCSGEGDFAARSGCGFDLGHPETGKTQPFSLLGIIAGPSVDAMAPYLSGWKDGERSRDGKNRLQSILEEHGLSPSYGRPTMMPIHDGLYMFMANHEYGYSALDADDITAATIHARGEVHAMVNLLSNQAPGWQSARLVSTGEQIGLREGRRIHGLYTVTIDDIIEGKSHDDGICLVKGPIDVHSLDPNESKNHFNPWSLKKHIKQQPYEIPLRSLIAKDAPGVMMAGRCISGDFLAHSSYRVTGDAVALGEAAGAAAAACKKLQLQPHDLPFEEVAADIRRASSMAIAT